MANSFVRYTGNGSTTQYAVSFTYRDQADITVTINGVATTAFTYNASGTQITFTTAPANNSAIEIRRTTSQTSRLVDYAAGSVLTENDLDTDSNQAFFMGQEAIDNANDRILLDGSDFQWDATNKRIKNVSDPTANQDAVTKNYLENTWLSSADKANITTLAGISGLSSLASNSTNINTVAANNTNVTNVGTDIANVNIVATNISSVNTVATDITKVIAVANDLAEAVSEVDTVAQDLQETTSEIDTVANNIANVNTVGNDIANVNAVGNDIANVNTVATNLTSVNDFAARYRVSSSAPTTSLDVGDLWFDSSSNTMKVYSASGFQNAGSSVNGTADRYQYTATNGQTTFSGNDSAGNSLAYDPPYLDVFLNGVRLANADFTATTGSSIVLASGAATGDILSVTAYGTFSLAAINANNVTTGTLSTGRGGTGLSTLGSAGQAIVVNAAGNALEFSNASSAEVYGFETYFNPSTLIKTVTESGSKYFIDGIQQDTLELLKGNTYVFNHPSSHPFRFSTDSGNSSAYTTGVTVNSSTQVTIVVASDAPTTLYYYCSSHSNMGGQANVSLPADNALRVTTTNQGQDNISNTTYANFDDVLYAASGFTWGITNGELIATI
jgi:hypothetical protein